MPARARREPARSTSRSGGRCRRSGSRASPSACCRSPASRSPRSSRIARRTSWLQSNTESGRRRVAVAARSAGACSSLLALDVRVPVFGAVAPGPRATRPTRRSAATGGCSSCPCSDPDIHFGCVYLGYARQSPARAAAGLLDDRAAGRRPARAQVARALVRPRLDARRARHALRRRPPRALPAERLLRTRLRRPRRGGASPRRLAAARPRRRRSRCWKAPPDVSMSVHVATRRTRDRLPGGDPQRERLRRRDRDAAPGGAAPVRAARQPAVAEARGPPAHLLVQAPRRLQQDVPPAGGSAPAGRRRRLRRQPRAGCRARGTAARDRGDDRDAGHDAADQDRLGRGARGNRRPRGRLLRRRLRRGDAHRATPEAHVRPSLRRPRRDRGAGHDRDGDPAPAARADRRDLRRGRRRRADRWHRRLREAPPAGDPHRRGRAGRRERDGALAAGRPPDHAPPRRPLRRRGRGEAGRRRAVPPRPPLRRRDDPRRHRRAVRRDEGRVRGHPHDRGAVGGARRGRREALRRAGEDQRAEPRHRALRGEHELRPAPLRRGASRPRRGPRGGVRGDDPGAARQLQGLLPPARAEQHHRVQLPLRRPRPRPTCSSA